jgi:hypothetical protein
MEYFEHFQIGSQSVTRQKRREWTKGGMNKQER